MLKESSVGTLKFYGTRHAAERAILNLNAVNWMSTEKRASLPCLISGRDADSRF
jgi:hypothetical protein